MIGRVLCCGFKEIVPPEHKLGLKPYVFRGDDKKYKNPKDLADDGKLCLAIKTELERFDIVIAHNGKLFDRKFLNARLMKAGHEPLRSIFFIDTMWTVRTHLRTSSKLDNVQQFLGLEDAKTKITWDDWARAMSNDKKSMDAIVEHCTQDVLVLEQAHWRLLPAMRTLSRA
jgi:uncharacterized protein YprB with RNaseH-like and TPR domain